MMALGGPGPAEMMVLLMFLGGFGLPLGVPPQAENPAMQHVAPAKCLLYATWAGMGTPDGKSANQTEQLLAEPEIQEFARSLEKSIGDALKRFAEQSGDPKAEHAAKMGPLWAKTVVTRSAAVFATKIEAGKDKLDFEGGILVDAGENAAALADGLVQLMSSNDNAPEPVMIGKAKFQRFAASERGPITGDVTIGAAGQYVFVGIGTDAVEGMVDRLKARQTPAWLTDLQDRLPVERRASMSYINTKGLVDAFLPLAGAEGVRIADSLGLRLLGEIQAVTGLDKEGMVNRNFMKIEGEPKGLLTLLGGEGIKPEQVDFIPKDATLAAAFSFNPQTLYNVVQQLVVENAPGGASEFDEMADQFEGMFGLRLKEDLLASLGSVWTISMSEADGWLGITATVEVKDRAKLVAMLQRIEAMLGDMGDGESPKIETRKFGKHEIQILSIPQVPIRPAWCVTESRVIFSIAPQSVKANLSARPEESGLFAGPEFASAFKGQGETLSIGYQDSAKLFQTTYGYVTLLAPMMMEGMNEANRFRGQPPGPPPFDFSTLPSARSIYRHLRPGITITRRTKDGLETESRQTFPTPNIGTSGPIAVALLLPAVQAAREAARRSQSMNNLKQIALGMHNHADAYRSLPPAYSTDKDGKPLLSWRVHMLPFIDQNALYQQFHLDEPWDSEHNKTLIEKMPEVYRSPNSTAKPGMTNYLAVAGATGIFSPPKKPTDGHRGDVTFASIADGTSNTIAFVETNDEAAVIWTKPADLIPNEKDPTKGLLGLRPGGFNAALCDGSVRFISETIDPKMLMNLFMRNDGNVVDFE